MVYMNRVFFWGIIFSFFCLYSCQNPGTVTDSSQAIKNRSWSYANKIRIPVEIVDETASYNIYINLRHTGDYKYSNIFLRIHTKGLTGKAISERKEYTLAYPDGQWLGKGSGNLYSYQLPFKENFRFPRKGKYLFEIEQNMRDNPLKEVTDIGLSIEKSK